MPEPGPSYLVATTIDAAMLDNLERRLIALLVLVWQLQRKRCKIIALD